MNDTTSETRTEQVEKIAPRLFETREAALAALDACKIESPEAAFFRARAYRHRESAAESFERCDTDGFLSQWASGENAKEDVLRAQVADHGGLDVHRVAVDEAGSLVGWRSYILPGFRPYNAPTVRWMIAREGAEPRFVTDGPRAMKKEGLRIGWMIAPARVCYARSPYDRRPHERGMPSGPLPVFTIVNEAETLLPRWKPRDEQPPRDRD